MENKVTFLIVRDNVIMMNYNNKQKAEMENEIYIAWIN